MLANDLNSTGLPARNGARVCVRVSDTRQPPRIALPLTERERKVMEQEIAELYVMRCCCLEHCSDLGEVV